MDAGLSLWEVYREDASFAGGTLDIDAAVVELYDMFHDREAETCAAE